MSVPCGGVHSQWFSLCHTNPLFHGLYIFNYASRRTFQLGAEGLILLTSAGLWEEPYLMAPAFTSIHL